MTETRGVGEATISKKWGGVVREFFTDADTFMIDFGSGEWTDDQRRVIFAAALRRRPTRDARMWQQSQGEVPNQAMSLVGLRHA